jgi:hypothetical protein
MHIKTNNTISTLEFESLLNPESAFGYEYSMSIWLQFDEVICFANSSANARKCNLVDFTGVFTLYMTSNNTARFTFASKINAYQV